MRTRLRDLNSHVRWSVVKCGDLWAAIAPCSGSEDAYPGFDTHAEAFSYAAQHAVRGSHEAPC